MDKLLRSEEEAFSTSASLALLPPEASSLIDFLLSFEALVFVFDKDLREGDGEEAGLPLLNEPWPLLKKVFSFLGWVLTSDLPNAADEELLEGEGDTETPPPPVLDLLSNFLEGEGEGEGDWDGEGPPRKEERPTEPLLKLLFKPTCLPATRFTYEPRDDDDDFSEVVEETDEVVDEDVVAVRLPLVSPPPPVTMSALSDLCINEPPEYDFSLDTVE
jgi:hypothetical protein